MREKEGLFFNISKKAQVTLFIILAVLILTSVIMVFFFAGKARLIAPSKQNIAEEIRLCAEDSVQEQIPSILNNGGITGPNLAIRYQGENYTYLCYTGNYYDKCYNLYPMLKNRIEKELEEQTKKKIQNCFDKVRQDLESQGYDVSGESASYSVEISRGNININLKKKITVSNGETSFSLSIFDTRVKSSIYDFVELIEKIVNSESEECDFDFISYMLNNPQYNIKRTNYEGSDLYWIENRQTGEKTKFAVRSCALPSGA